jgi:SAM-dependent methyltransferase
VTSLLGTGSGRCLDLCCGTGVHLPVIQALGWQVVGLDISTDQLRLAAGRAAEAQAKLVQASADDLPFEDNAFQAVVSLFSHTDVDDFPRVLREAARVLQPGGVLVYVGLHPCFVGPHADEKDRAVPVLHPGYSDRRRHYEGPGLSPEGLWSKVGGVHIPLAPLLEAFLDASFTLERFVELGDGDYPRAFGLRARGTMTP